MKSAFPFGKICLTLLFVSAVPARNKGCGNKTTSCQYYCHNCDTVIKSRPVCYQVAVTQCVLTFNKSMYSMDRENWCSFNNISRAYSEFTECTEMFAECLLIPWPNKMIEELFVDLHSTHFKNCDLNEYNDPPPEIVGILTMTPICLIPLMVTLVVWKTKNGDNSS